MTTTLPGVCMPQRLPGTMSTNSTPENKQTMHQTHAHSPNPLDTLSDLADRYGWTPWFSLDTRENPGEITAHFAAAPAFVNAMIAQAEPQHQAGNRIGVQAAMIEAHSWMERLATTLTWEDMPDEDRRDSGLHRAIERLSEAGERYAASLDNQQTEEDAPLMALWRAALLPAGHAAALDHHVARLKEETDQQVLEQHNSAVRVSVMTLEQAAQNLQQLRSAHTTGTGPSNRQMRRCLQQVTDAMERCGEITEIMDSTVPITLNEDIATDELLAQEARELGENLRTGESDYAIMENPGNPADSLIAYRSQNSVRVKRIIDHYEDGTPEDYAVAHALSFMQIAEDLIENGDENAPIFRSVAQLVYDNACAGMHEIDRMECALFVEALRSINDDPIQVRHAVMTALSEEYSGAELLLAVGSNEDEAVSSDQAHAVIQAARANGLPDGKLRALAYAMECHPSELGLPPPQATAEDITDALDCCPEPLSLHQTAKIVIAMGGNPAEDAIVAWTQDNCYDALADEQGEEI